MLRRILANSVITAMLAGDMSVPHAQENEFTPNRHPHPRPIDSVELAASGVHERLALPRRQPGRRMRVSSATHEPLTDSEPTGARPSWPGPGASSP
jgi:hypothetical protein